MPQLVSNGLFYFFSLVAILLALGVVLSRKLLRAAVYLMGVLVTSAGFYLMLGAEFLAGVQILVYVGGIVVLLVFAIMLTRHVGSDEERPLLSRRIIAYLAALVFFVVASSFLAASVVPLGGSVIPPMPPDNTAQIGRRLLDRGPSGYLLPFEVISILLLGAVIGGIVIARKERH